MYVHITIYLYIHIIIMFILCVDDPMVSLGKSARNSSESMYISVSLVSNLHWDDQDERAATFYDDIFGQ